MPRPITSRDLPAAAAATTAFTPVNLPPAVTAPRPHGLEILPLPIASPRLEARRNLTPAAVGHHPTANEKVPPATNAPRSAMSGVHSPVATAPSPFIPLFQLPIAASVSACASRRAHEHTTLTGHGKPRQDTGKGCIKEESDKGCIKKEPDKGCIKEKSDKECIKEEPDKGFRTHYKNMYQDAMRKELKARGLLCHGPNADLVKRLEEDDGFQAKPRIVENYDTMSLKDIRSLCVRRSIPSTDMISSLRDRLKAHDQGKRRLEAAGPGLSPLSAPCGRLSTLEEKNSKEIIEEKPLMPAVKDEPATVTEAIDPVNDLPLNVRARSLSKTDSATKYGYEEAKRLSQRATRRAEVEGGQLQAKRAEVSGKMAENVTPAKPLNFMSHRRTSCDDCRRRKVSILSHG